jgi:hypothetical protein
VQGTPRPRLPRECRRIHLCFLLVLGARVALPGAATGLEASGPSREGSGAWCAPGALPHPLGGAGSGAGLGRPARRGIESHADCTHPIGGLAGVGRTPCWSGARGPRPSPAAEGKCAWSLSPSPIEDALEMGGPGMPRVATSARRQWGEGVDKW